MVVKDSEDGMKNCEPRPEKSESNKPCGSQQILNEKARQVLEGAREPVMQTGRAISYDAGTCSSTTPGNENPDFRYTNSDPPMLPVHGTHQLSLT